MMTQKERVRKIKAAAQPQRKIRTIQIRGVDAELWKKYKQLAMDNDVSASDLIRYHIEMTVNW
ncbi:MAG: hypothetical protein SVM79_00095 [Chloroflexota bacterium]|nr:hypothetical protein [Chloroflexota bacterium]